MRPHSYMRAITLLALTLAVFFNNAALQPAQAASTSAPVHTTKPAAAQLPFYFIANQGQLDAQVAYYARGQGYTFFFTENALVMTLGQEVLRTRFSGARAVMPTGMQPMRARVNDFSGNDPTRWHAALPTYGALVYQALYPGIDLHYTGQGGALKYAFTLQPGADPAQIRLSLEGNDALSLDTAGNLRIQVADRVLYDERPVAYQQIGGRRVEVAVSFALHDQHSYGFSLPEGYDARYPLVIDPSLDYASFLGGTEIDDAVDLVVDDAGYVYVAGATRSTDFPATAGSYASTHQGGLCGDSFLGYFPCDDAFIAKFDLSQSGEDALVYSTFLGGSDVDRASAVAVDSAGYVYVKGSTYSTDFPTVNAYQTECSNACLGHKGDFFIAKLSPAGDALLYASYLGGSDAVASYGGLAVDDAGHAHITGYTRSTDFPTTADALQPDFAGGYWDGIIASFDTTQAGAASLRYASYLGGSGEDLLNDLVMDAQGNLYVGGYTDSPDLPITAQAFQDSIAGGRDNFVIKVRPDGSAPIYGTYVGGSSFYDRLHGMAVNAAGEACFVGDTKSLDWPTTSDAYQPEPAESFETYITCLNADGSDLTYSTYLGGASGDYGYDILLDTENQAYVVGYTASQDFPTVDPIQPTNAGAIDVFVSQLDLNSGELRFSTYLGGSDDDWVGGDYWDFSRAIARDKDGALYISGYSTSEDFPVTENAYQPAHAGGDQDAFIAKLDPKPSFYTISGHVRDAAGEGFGTITLSAGTPYSATTGASGYYSLTVPSGTYTLTPTMAGYFWEPGERVVHVPPDASGQDFIGRSLVKANAPGANVEMDGGEAITYTIKVKLPQSGVMSFYDVLPKRTTYVPNSLHAPDGLAYHLATHVISGDLSLTAAIPLTVSFAVRIATRETSIIIAQPITNRACLAPQGAGLEDCLWSNTVRNYTHFRRLYLPLIVRDKL